MALICANRPLGVNLLIRKGYHQFPLKVLAKETALEHADMHRCTWVKPTTLARVEFVEWTNAGKLRHPHFRDVDLGAVRRPR
jgi:ATP-dependent DNA ligase